MRGIAGADPTHASGVGRGGPAGRQPDRLLADPAAGVPLGPAGAGDDRDALPLVGRDRELATLLERWEQARSGHGGVVIVRGPAGSGRSRLAREVAARVREQGRPVLAAAAEPDGAPLAALRTAVAGYLAATRRLPADRQAEVDGWLRAAAGSAGSKLGRLGAGLGRLLPESRAGGGGDRPDDFYPALADYFAGLARAAGGALLCLDGAEWLSGATRRVLQSLAGQLAGTPLLVLLTAPPADPTDPADDPGGLRGLGLGELTVPVGPLDAAAVAALVATLTGGAQPGPALAQWLAGRSGGTPYGVREYLSALADAGLPRPSAGTWVLDADALDRLDLPADVHGVALRRIAELPAETRDLLQVAAALGLRFEPELAVAGSNAAGRPDAAQLLDQAVTRGLLERRDGELWFVHAQVRAALLAGAGAERRREIHRRIAARLEAAGRPGAEHCYALARHRLRAEPSPDPARTVSACVAAGRLALADHAPAEAIEFLEPAAALAEAGWAGRTGRPGEVCELLGTAYHRAGRFADAVATLNRALLATPGGLERARVLAVLTRVYQCTWNAADAMDTARRALAELGRRLPAGGPPLAASTLLTGVAGTFVERTRVGFGTVTGPRRARFRLQAELYDVIAETALRDTDPLLAGLLALRSMYVAGRLGYSAEYVKARGRLSILWQIGKLPWYRGGFDRAAAAAAASGDPVPIAYVDFLRIAGDAMTGRRPDRDLMRFLADRGTLLDARSYLDAVAGCCASLLLRGYPEEARVLYEHADARLAGSDVVGHLWQAVGVEIPAALGRLAEAEVRLQAFTRSAGAPGRGLQVNRLMAAAQVAVEQQDVGAGFVLLAAEFAALRVSPRHLIAPQLPVYVALAFGLLERCRRMPAGERGEAYRTTRQAVTALSGATVNACVAGYAAVGRAALRQLAGDHTGALDALAGADRLLRHADAPLVGYEAARVRARALAGLGLSADAAAAATTAALLARRHGWPHRAAWVQAEFPEHRWSYRPPGRPGG